MHLLKRPRSHFLQPVSYKHKHEAFRYSSDPLLSYWVSFVERVNTVIVFDIVRFVYPRFEIF